MNSPRKPHVQKNCRSRDIHPQSSDFGQKRQKWCLKNALYLENRKCYRKSDLIFGIYDKFSFAHVSSDFCPLVVFRVKNWVKDGQFSCIFWMVLGHFLANHLKYFDETWSEVRQNGYEEDAKDQKPTFWAYLEIFGLKIAKNRPKSPKFYGWSKNFSKKIFLAQTILNGPIRKVIIVKVKFEDLRNFFYYQVNQARHLENFSKNFSKKIFLFKKFLNGPIRKVIVVKVKFDDLWKIFPLAVHWLDT